MSYALRAAQVVSFALLTVPAIARADGNARADGIAEGAHVFARHAGMSFRDEDRSIGPVLPGMMLDVIKVQGPWLWVGRGWVPAHDVVPMDSALAFYCQQIDQQPTYFALVTRARVYYERREYDLAVADCSQAIALVPEAESTSALSMRARALARINQHDQAMTDLNRAIQIDPKCGVAYAGRGHLYLELGDPSKALEDFDRGVEFDPRSAWTRGGMGRAQATLGDYDRAIADFGATLAINPYLRAIWNNRGNAWFKKGDYSHALADYTVAIELGPTAQIYFNRALAWGRLGAADKADRDMAKALELDPKFGPAKRHDLKQEPEDQRS
ncbi:MAG TPA: tetratricopeptide repeat protein [Pirellulales bacterium]